MLEQFFRVAEEFDVLHNHLDVLTMPFARRCQVPLLTTLHGRLDLEDLGPFYQEYSEQWVVSISDSQRDPLPEARWVGTVYHGLPRELYRLHPATARSPPGTLPRRGGTGRSRWPSEAAGPSESRPRWTPSMSSTSRT